MTERGRAGPGELGGGWRDRAGASGCLRRHRACGAGAPRDWVDLGELSEGAAWRRSMGCIKGVRREISYFQLKSVPRPTSLFRRARDPILLFPRCVPSLTCVIPLIPYCLTRPLPPTFFSPVALCSLPHHIAASPPWPRLHSPPSPRRP
jgi:hypothetical protein